MVGAWMNRIILANAPKYFIPIKGPFQLILMIQNMRVWFDQNKLLSGSLAQNANYISFISCFTSEWNKKKKIRNLWGQEVLRFFMNTKNGPIKKLTEPVPQVEWISVSCWSWQCYDKLYQLLTTSYILSLRWAPDDPLLCTTKKAVFDIFTYLSSHLIKITLSVPIPKAAAPFFTEKWLWKNTFIIIYWFYCLLCIWI